MLPDLDDNNWTSVLNKFQLGVHPYLQRQRLLLRKDGNALWFKELKHDDFVRFFINSQNSIGRPVEGLNFCINAAVEGFVENERYFQIQPCLSPLNVLSKVSKIDRTIAMSTDAIALFRCDKAPL